MAKRFTDISKWRNGWFRTLSQRAKLSWIYLCDECDYAGVWKADYGLASFQLDFTLTNQLLKEWFGDKVHMFDGDSVLIVQFFEFQYGQSKDTWNAKVTARNRLETLGFKIENNKVKIDSHPTVGGESQTILITGTGIVTGIGNNTNTAENSKIDFESIYKLYPLKKGKEAGLKIARREIKTIEDADLLIKVILKYKNQCEINGTDPKYIKHFSTFMNNWREVLDEDYGTTTVQTSNQNDVRDRVRALVSQLGSSNGKEAWSRMDAEEANFVRLNGGWPQVCSTQNNDFAWSKLLTKKESESA